MVAVDDTQLSWQAVRFTLEELYRNGGVGCIAGWGPDLDSPSLDRSFHFKAII